MAKGNAEGNHEQEVGYSSPQTTSGANQDQPGSNAFPSEQQQKQAASSNKVHYSSAPGADDLSDGPGTGPTVPGQFGGTTSTANNADAGATAGATERNSTPLRDDNASSPGLAPDRAGSYPGPGTATDRGTGNVGSTPFGTGVSDNGLEATSGLDERNTTNTNSASYNPIDDVGNPLSGSGVTGTGTPGRDNEFGELGTTGSDLSPRDSTGGSR